MKLLPLLVLVCFVLYEVLQVEGRSKHDVKKLLQKYIHHHNHHYHHHPHYHHHHHHHHHHRRHHHHHHKHPHHKHSHHHHHHHHHHKSFHQKLVDKLKKEKQEHPQQNVSMKTTKRESLPKLLFTLGKGFMKLGKDLDKKKSPTGKTEVPTIKHVKNADTFYVHAPTSKSVVQLAATQAAIPFFTPSPTSAYFDENDVKDDIGADALTPAYTQPTPTASQKGTPPIIDETQSNNHERKKHDLKKQGLTAITPTPSAKPSAKPTVVSSSKTNDEQKFMGEMKPTNRALKNPTVKPKVADSHSNKKNKSVEFNNQSDKDIDKKQDAVSGRKISMVKEEDSVPNPSIEIPAGQASLLEQSPTESSIDGGQDINKDESPQTEYENQFTTFRATSGNTNPNIFVSEPNINEDATLLAINATQNADKVMGFDAEDDIAANYEAKGARPVNIGDSSVEAKVSDTIDKPGGDHAEGTLQRNGETKKQPVATKVADDNPAQEEIDGQVPIASNGNLNIEPKAEEIKGTISDEIMDGEVPPADLQNDHNSVFGSAAKDVSPPKSLLAFSQDSASSIDGTAQPYSQESASASDDIVKSPARDSIDGPAQTTPQSDSAADGVVKTPTTISGITTDEIAQSEEALPKLTIPESVGNIDGVAQTTPQSDSTTDEIAQSDSAEEALPQLTTSESVGNVDGVTQTIPQSDSKETLPKQKSVSTTNGTNQPTMQSGNSVDGAVPASNDGPQNSLAEASSRGNGDDIRGGTAQPSNHGSETFKDASKPFIGSNDTAAVALEPSTHSETEEDAPQPSVGSDDTAESIAQSSIHDSDYESASQPTISSKSTDKLAQPDDLNHASYDDAANDHQSKGTEDKTSSHQSDSNLDNEAESRSPPATDTTVDLSVPPYQSNATSDETYSLTSHSREAVVPTLGSEDSKGEVAQSLDGNVDEAVNPTGDLGKKNLEDAPPQQKQNKNINPKNVEVGPEEQKTPKAVGSQPPNETGVIEDGEVPPPADSIDATTSVPPKTQGFNTENLYDSVI